MNTIQSLPALKGKKVLIRADYNVPLKGNKILDTRRIESSYKTIDTILKKGGVPIVASHLGDSEASLRPVATFLSKKYNTVFVTESIESPHIHTIITAVPKGVVILLENIRQYEGEEGNTKAFAKSLASLADLYVNDAFSVSHRKHASVVGVPKLLPSYAGAQLEKEIKMLNAVIEKPKHPFLFILGGAKLATKLPLLKKFATVADSIVVGGANVNTFYKAAGFEIGDSVAESGHDSVVKSFLNSSKLLLPVDVVVTRSISGKAKKMTLTLDEVQKGDVIVDIGPQSVELVIEKIKKAKLIVWNGPMGWYEKGFTGATVALARAITSATATTIIGGGDTGAAIDTALADTHNKKVFVSTGGGATLDYLATGTLPGIKVLG